MKIIRIKYLVITFILCINTNVSAQRWGELPGFPDDGGLTLFDQSSFIVVIGMASISYSLAEFVLQNGENLNYYLIRGGFVGAYEGSVLIENFGIEKRVAPWFGIGLEINNQQWFYNEGNGLGIGFNAYYRWHLFGKKRISPYLEYGTGLFYGFSEFPPNGTNFTFNLTSQVGIEYTLKSQNKIRFSYGHLHQSNNGLLEPNPGTDGNGFNITFLWFWKKTKW